MRDLFKKRLPDEEKRLIQEYITESQVYRQKVHDTFGPEDYHFTRMEQTYAEITEPGTLISYQVGKSFAKWAVENLDQIGVEPTAHCTCAGGWTETAPETDQWRPCSRCNREAYERFTGLSGPSQAPPEPEDDWEQEQF